MLFGVLWFGLTFGVGCWLLWFAFLRVDLLIVLFV